MTTLGKGILGSTRFDKIALTCSAMYFLFFTASVACIQSGQCSSTGTLALTYLKILTLILPVMFFAKLLWNSIYDSRFNAPSY